MSEFEDKVVIVTGAGQGIGSVIAQVLAGYGAKIVATDLNLAGAEGTVAELAGEGLALQQDVSDPTSTLAVLAAAHERFGRVDVLVNNAGVAMQHKIEDVTEAQWDLTQNVNAKGVFFACQAAGQYFREHGGGKIVNIASFVGKQAIDEYGPYNASKAAVIGITQSFAIELGPDGINVNAVCPGVVRTPMWETLAPEQWDKQVAKIPLGRGQSMQDIGEAVAFLASDRARSITGASLPVTGGLAMW